MAYLSNLGLKTKLFVNAVGTYAVQPLQHPIKRFLLGRSYSKAHRVFCISSFVKKRILHYLPDLKNLEVVNLGSDFEIHPELIRTKLPDHTTIISVGALKNRKGQHLTILALKRIKEKVPKIQLRIIGSQENKKQFEYLKKLVKQNNLKKQVCFLHNLSDDELKGEYKKADLFCMPSITVNDNLEGFGLVYLEAAAYGLPCVGSLNTGAEDAIGDGYNGYLVKHNNLEDLEEKIIKILTDEKLYCSMSKNGMEWVKKFTWEKTIDSYLNGYLN